MATHSNATTVCESIFSMQEQKLVFYTIFAIMHLAPDVYLLEPFFSMQEQS